MENDRAAIDEAAAALEAAKAEKPKAPDLTGRDELETELKAYGRARGRAVEARTRLEAVDDAEVSHIIAAYQTVGGEPISEAEVRAAGADPQTPDLDAHLSRMAGQLNEQGKLAVVRSAFRVAAADGEFQEEERALMAKLATALSVDNPFEAPR